MADEGGLEFAKVFEVHLQRWTTERKWEHFMVWKVYSSTASDAMEAAIKELDESGDPRRVSRVELLHKIDLVA